MMNIIVGKSKQVEIEGRRYIITKFTAFAGLKIAKTFIAKIVPIFQSFMPLITKAASGDENAKDDVLSELGKYLDFEGIGRALDLVSPNDLDYVMSNSLMCCYEVLPAGNVQVLRTDGIYGVQDIEYDMLLVMRLVCEAILWGLGDFFTEGRLASIMTPLSSSLPLNL